MLFYLSEWPTTATIYPSDPPDKAELDEEMRHRIVTFLSQTQ